MKASLVLTLGFASLVGMMACSNGAGSPADGNGGGGDGNGNGGKVEYATGRVWVGKDGWFGSTPGEAQVFDLKTGERLSRAQLPGDPLQIALNSKYAFVLCTKGRLARVRRSDMKVDSLIVEKKSDNGFYTVHLAADETQVWLADVNEGFIHIDPETMTEVGRMRFTNPSANSVWGLRIVAGYPWVLVGGSSFRLVKVNPSDRTAAATIGLGMASGRVNLPRSTGRTGWGVMGVSGTWALVYAYEEEAFLRVDLAGEKVEAAWAADWSSWTRLSAGKELRIDGYDGGFLVTHSDSLWVRRLGTTGTDFKEHVLQTYPVSTAARKDGLFAAGYFSGGTGLVRAASMDSVAGLEWALDPPALAFEQAR